MQKELSQYLPKKSVDTVEHWLNKYNCRLNIKSPRRTRLGDYKYYNKQHYISINNNLNPYSFLITLMHEIAHMIVKVTYPINVSPHGIEWKQTFKGLMIPLLPVFPLDIQKPLAKHLKNPKASSCSDHELMTALRVFDQQKVTTISDIPNGTLFFTSNGKTFLKEKKLRTRFQCKCLSNNRTYLFSPLAEIIL